MHILWSLAEISTMPQRSSRQPRLARRRHPSQSNANNTNYRGEGTCVFSQGRNSLDNEQSVLDDISGKLAGLELEETEPAASRPKPASQPDMRSQKDCT
jgi:hypothetical protein